MEGKMDSRGDVQMIDIHPTVWLKRLKRCVWNVPRVCARKMAFVEANDKSFWARRRRYEMRKWSSEKERRQRERRKKSFLRSNFFHFRAVIVFKTKSSTLMENVILFVSFCCVAMVDVLCTYNVSPEWHVQLFHIFGEILRGRRGEWDLLMGTTWTFPYCDRILPSIMPRVKKFLCDNISNVCSGFFWPLLRK